MIWPCSPALRAWMKTARSLEREGVLGALASGGTKWFWRRHYVTLIRHPVLSVSFFVNVRPASYLENVVPQRSIVETQQILAKWIVPKGNWRPSAHSVLLTLLSLLSSPSFAPIQHAASNTPTPSNSMNVSKNLFSKADNFQ